MLLAVVLSIVFISRELHFSIGNLVTRIWNSDMSKIINTDWQSPRFFVKQFLSGVFISIAMTGLDQEMMQKNLSCRNLREAQTNMFTFSGTLVFVNLIFLFLGAVLLIYSGNQLIAVKYTDDMFDIGSISKCRCGFNLTYYVILYRFSWF